MKASRLSSRKVNGVGPIDAKIMVVGEAPGIEEERLGEPFVGKSGELNDRYFADRLGIPRTDLRITNVCKYRPNRNDFKYALDSEQLEEGLVELASEIALVQPNVIIAMGNWPLYFLTGKTNDAGKAGTGIMNWRGSMLPCTLTKQLDIREIKVLACYHPAFVLRVWNWHPIFLMDLERAQEESLFPEIRYPVYEEFIDPPVDVIEERIRDMAGAKWISYDIETLPNRTMSCFGATSSDEWGLCITHNNPLMADVAREILELETPKLAQYGTYDRNFLLRFYGIETRNFGYDTYIAAANLMPTFPKGLDFLASIYTRFPYYKVERKEWKEKDDTEVLWKYNIKDVIATYQIAMAQMEEFPWDVYPFIPKSAESQ